MQKLLGSCWRPLASSRQLTSRRWASSLPAADKSTSAPPQPLVTPHSSAALSKELPVDGLGAVDLSSKAAILPRRSGSLGSSEVTQLTRKLDPLVHTMLLNAIMKKGNRGAAQGIMRGVHAILRRQHGERMNIHTFVEEAINNIRPFLEIRSIRVSGTMHRVPKAIKPRREVGIAIRWLLEKAKERTEKGLAAKLAAELQDAKKHRGAAFRRKEEVHKLALFNRTNLKYL